ncbi:MAG: hypothetical protein V3U65_03240 [Granulosicoccaceae bacterium]
MPSFTGYPINDTKLDIVIADEKRKAGVISSALYRCLNLEF